MDRISGANNIDIGGGRRGFRDRNLGAGLAGTQVNALWANGIQEGFLALVEAAGLTPTDASYAQLLQAVRRLAGADVATVTATGALTADHSGVVFVSAAGGNVTLTLPAANAISGTVSGVATVNPLPLIVLRTDTSANTVTLQRAGTDTLAPGAQTSYSLGVGEVISIVSDGASAWFQLWSNMTGRRSATFTSSGSWTVPAWVNRGKVTVVGGGASGAGTTATGAGQISIAPGGNSGCIGIGLYNVTPGTAYTVTIGAGGTWNLGTGLSVAGGTTSFGALVSAPGGTAGISNSPAATAPLIQGGLGVSAVATGGQINAYEAAGDFSIGTTISNFASGKGANCPPYGVGGASIQSASFNGSNGLGYGAGGAGGATGASALQKAGGTGAPGLAIVEY